MENLELLLLPDVSFNPPLNLFVINPSFPTLTVHTPEPLNYFSTRLTTADVQNKTTEKNPITKDNEEEARFLKTEETISAKNK